MNETRKRRRHRSECPKRVYPYKGCACRPDHPEQGKLMTDAPAMLPSRVTVRWLRSLTDPELADAYRAALWEDEHFQSMADARTTSARLIRVVDEMARRQGAGKLRMRL